MEQLFVVLLLSSTLALPAFAQKHQSDREAEGLKGPVKTVATEMTELKQSSGRPVESARMPVSTVAFDADGHITLRKHYGYLGELADSVTYSFLNGERVLRHEVVVTKHTLVIATPAPAKQPARPPNPVFTYKVKYKYDGDGNRTEEAWLNSDGSPRLRHVYKLSGNRKEELVYSEDGSLNQKYVYTLDEKGNEVEKLVYSVRDGSIDHKVTYSYVEFDPQGNWVKRVESRGDRKSKFALRPARVTYRAITYH